MAHESGAHRLLAIDQLSSRPRVPSLRHLGDLRVRRLTCRDQDLAVAFAQLTYRESLRDIEACLRSLQGKLCHLGFRGQVARSTLADANKSRDWRIFADFAHRLVATPRGFYVREPMGVDLEQILHALDSTTYLSVSSAVSVGPGSGEAKLPSKNCRKCQPTDSLRLLTGQP